jgi:hypothetical protein
MQAIPHSNPHLPDRQTLLCYLQALWLQTAMVTVVAQATIRR